HDLSDRTWESHFDLSKAAATRTAWRVLFLNCCITEGSGSVADERSSSKAYNCGRRATAPVTGTVVIMTQPSARTFFVTHEAARADELPRIPARKRPVKDSRIRATSSG